jgi:HSP20 family protein
MIMLVALEAVPALGGLLDDVMGSAIGYATKATVFTPSVDVIAKEHELVFQLDVPGVRPENLEVTLEKHVLSIKGSRRYEAGPNERQMLLGRSYGDFALRYTLPETADGEKLAAYLADGVLTLRVPKHPKAQPRKIQIGGGGRSELGR